MILQPGNDRCTVGRWVALQQGGRGNDDSGRAITALRRALGNHGILDRGTDWIVGVLGALQFDVMADRIRSEYDVPVKFESTSLHTARWVEADDANLLKKFMDANGSAIADDHDDMPVFLARNAWHLDNAAEEWPDVRFLKTKEQTQ